MDDRRHRAAPSALQRPHCRIVVVLAMAVIDLALARRELRRPETSGDQNLAEQRQDRLEVFGKAGADRATTGAG